MHESLWDKKEMSSSSAWPMLLDYTSDECKRNLRKLELEAYASVVSAFRAQGEMNKDKKKMLQELSIALSISLERHKAEIRRAVNDEHLNTIADRLAGPNTSTEWSIEGRRVLPLMPRLVPQTAFTALANCAADTQAAKNALMPVPSATGLKEMFSEDIVEIENRYKRPPSVELDEVPQKILAADSYSVLSPPGAETVNDNTDFLTESSQVPQLQSGTDKGESVSFRKCSTKVSVPYSMQKSVCSVPACTPSKPATTESFLQASGILRSASASVTKTVASLVTLASQSEIKHTQSSNLVGSFTHHQEHTGASDFNISSSDSTRSHDMLTMSSSSVGGLPQTTINSCAVSSTFGNKPRAKLFSSKPVVKPRLSTCSSFNGSSVQSVSSGSLNLAASTSDQPYHKTLSPVKCRTTFSKVSPSVLPPTNCVSQCQTSHGVQSFIGAQPPVATAPRVTSSAVNSHRATSPVTFKQCSAAMPFPALNKQTVSPRSLNKCSAVKTSLGPKPVLTSAAKSCLPKFTGSFSSTSPPPTVCSWPSVHPSVKTSPQTGGKCVSVTGAQKAVTCQSQPKSSNAVTKPVHHRNENAAGLKIISQNVNANWLTSKAGTSFSSSASNSSSRLSIPSTASGVAGSARIINFSQPVGSRFTRSSSTSASSGNLSNTLPTNSLRVAVPVGVGNTSVMRSTVPAKPNVIVVHKAQVWPQAPGATIVMTSSGPLTRLSSEAIEEAVTLIHRQDATHHSAASLKTLSTHQAPVALPDSSDLLSQPFQTAKESLSGVQKNEEADGQTAEDAESLPKKNDEVSSPATLFCEDTLEDSPVDIKSHEDDGDIDGTELPPTLQNTALRKNTSSLVCIASEGVDEIMTDERDPVEKVGSNLQASHTVLHEINPEHLGQEGSFKPSTV